MAEYIEREEVMQAFADFVWNSNHSDLVPTPQWNHAVDIVKDYPAADVKPVVRSEWEQIEIIDDDSPDGVNNDVARCKNCGYQETAGLYWAQTYLHFCPNCGADMKGEEDG